MTLNTEWPVPMFTFASPSACHLYLPTKFRPNRTIRDRVITSYSFFKMAAVSHIELSQAYCRPPTKCKWGSKVGPQISTRSDLQFRRYCYFCVMRFRLQIAYTYMVVSTAHAHYAGGQSTSGAETNLIFFVGSICLFIVQLHRRSWPFKGCLLTKSPMLKPVLSWNFVLSKIGQQFGFFGENGVKL